MQNLYIFLLLFTFYFSKVTANIDLTNLQVENQTKPIGIDVNNPIFSWQLKDDKNLRGLQQDSYQLIVKAENDETVWNSGQVHSRLSHAISYKGKPLKATTIYEWELTVWTNNSEMFKATSIFETGLMNPNPNLEAWNGAVWIGGGDEDLVLYSDHLTVFQFQYDVKLNADTKSTKAAFVFGANDPRLMNKNHNIYNIENDENNSYISFELDISELDNSSGPAKLNVFRVGYHPDDSENEPFQVIKISEDLINDSNKYETHTIIAKTVFGVFQIFIETDEPKNEITSELRGNSPFGSPGLNLNPVGRGGDYICYPALGDIGFQIRPNQNATFSNVEIKNYRLPETTLFKENLENPDSYTGIFEAHKEKNELQISNNSYQLNGSNHFGLIISDPGKNSAPMLRTEFTTSKMIEKARLYITSRGIYEAYLNGNRISNDYFNPGLTQYNKTHLYQTYDITKHINKGENAIGAILSEGWWSGNITFTGSNWNFFGDRQSLLAKIELTYSDGSSEIITTEPNKWKLYTQGPIRNGSFFQGEVYDARLESSIKGWDSPGFDDSDWKSAQQVPLNGTTFNGNVPHFDGSQSQFNFNELGLKGQIGENVSIIKELTPVSVEEVRPGIFVYDMGQNMVGFPSIDINNGKRGQKITMRYAEVKYPNLPEHEGLEDMIMMENIRAALSHDIHFLKGGYEIIQPRFTFHGFRYLEVSGIDKAIPLNDVKGLVLSSVKNLTSDFQSSNELVNKLWKNITWSMMGNFLSIPTDTPARNERMGWSGDINVFAKTATYMANVNQFLKRHMLAMRDIQDKNGRFTGVAPVGGGFGGTLWSSAGIIVAWETYLQFGDLNLLKEHYDAMKAYIEFLEKRYNEDGILVEGPLGDWLSPENSRNDNTQLWTAYEVYILDIMTQVAEILGKSEDKEVFQQKALGRKAFFNHTYVNEESGKTIKSGVQTGFFGPPSASENGESEKGKILDTQASYAIPLAYDVFHEDIEDQMAESLVNTIKRENTDDSGVNRPPYSLMTGFIGTAAINPALSKFGYDSTAYKLLQNKNYPSWLYPVINGATTIWERLNSYTIEEGFGGNNSMNSFNHYSFGAVAAWLQARSLGIQRDTDHPGFKHFILQPTPDPTEQMTWAQGYYDSMYGRIESSWEITINGWKFETTIPPNSSAILLLQTKNPRLITESGKNLGEVEGISEIEYIEEGIKAHIQSGKYKFSIMK